MSKLGLNRMSYSLLSVKERAMYIVRDHLSEWFQSLHDDQRIKEMQADAKQRKVGQTASSRSHS